MLSIVSTAESCLGTEMFDIVKLISIVRLTEHVYLYKADRLKIIAVLDLCCYHSVFIGHYNNILSLLLVK